MGWSSFITFKIKNPEEAAHTAFSGFFTDSDYFIWSRFS